MKKKYLKYYIEKGIYKEEKYWYKKYYDKTWNTKKKDFKAKFVFKNCPLESL